MLRSSHTIQRSAPAPPSTPKKGTLRKSRSTDSLTSSPQAALNIAYDFPEPPKTAGRFLGLAMKSTTSLAHYSDSETGADARPIRSHARGLSEDVSRNYSKSHTTAMSKSELTGGKVIRAKGSISPERYAHLLIDSSSLTLDVEIVKKLRLLLRNEPARYVDRQSIKFFALTADLAGRPLLSTPTAILHYL